MLFSVLPMFSSKSFIVSGLILRSLIHFEFIFVYGIRKFSNFIILHVAVQFSQHHLLKRLSLPHCIFLPPLSKIGKDNGTPLQYSCQENPMDGRAWWAAVHGVAKSRTRLSNFTFTFQFHVLEKEMATHSSVLAQRIPGMGEPGELPSMGSQRVRHD